MDAHHNNLLLDPKDGLKIVDFELIQKYKVKPKRFEDSFDLAGVPKDEIRSFDRTIQKRGKRTYDNSWRRRTGLSLDSLLYDPVWKQVIKRTKHRIIVFPHAIFPAVRKNLLYPLYVARQRILLSVDRGIREIIIFLYH